MNTEDKQPPMNIMVIGANGGIGRQTVEYALASGHKVTALLRTPAKLHLVHPNLEIVKGDVRLPGTFEQYLENNDAVISALGDGMNKPTTLYSEGNASLLKSMKKMGARRAFFISASAIEVSPLQPFFIRLATKYIVQKLFRHGYADQRIMEKIIKESGINWTIVRPPRLTDKPATGHYRVAVNRFLKNCLRISRADTAHFMIDNINTVEMYQSTVEIGY